ncbi:MAG: Acetylglutamate kinase [Verrucomicrobia subdivision 3 bacterium]|nr:Acetylglutamate kinase [Limisphaerales bacterium]MCS1414610.1 Acetylglutamate kinase [Limisphaerales bacterium]
MQELIDKAATLLEALPYIQRFNGATFVVKYGGSFMDSPDPAVRSGVARDIVFLEAVGINPVVVHGGGKAISRAMKEAGLEPEFVQGHRATDNASVELVDRVLSSEINPEIVATIKDLGGGAIGVPGRNILHCRQKVFKTPEGESYNLGFVGEVTLIDVDPILQAIKEGITPVISPTARGHDGHLYNCNADLVAAELAVALKARRLVYMSDVPGLLRDPNDPDSVISKVSVAETKRLKADSIIGAGMIPKVSSAVEAIQAGVKKVSMVDGRVSHAVLLEIFTDQGVGTQVIP